MDGQVYEFGVQLMWDIANISHPGLPKMVLIMGGLFLVGGNRSSQDTFLPKSGKVNR